MQRRQHREQTVRMTPKDYEKAVLQRFRTRWPPPRFVVKHNIRLRGHKTKARRQVDVGIFEAGKSQPFLIVEAKRHKRPIDASIAGSTIALVQDVGGVPAVMISTTGFSRAASNHLGIEGIAHFTITLKEAQGLHWIPVVEQKFAVDREFREVSGHLVEALRNGDAAPFLDNVLPYEEWLATLHSGLSLFPEPTWSVLRVLAREHFDDGVRFNSVQLLDDADQLEPADIDALLKTERDPENVALLREMRA
jgi:hypothetical protein